MGKKRYTEGTWRSDPFFRRLCAAFRTCRTERDVANFLRDVATLAELKAMSERWEVARLLNAGVSYRGAAARTSASTTTVTRVAGFLRGDIGGYRSVLNHQHHCSPARRGERMVSKEYPVT
ncbi:hypothetical protein AUJ46_04155 [Candidatus Peregrinibacteria bacterium CG1_02_54_53]|nr:MAG: hypothetical protein AUJ46_04155 [Candidatus Peregrinibacteria bacterium CG1_02_54_53]